MNMKVTNDGRLRRNALCIAMGFCMASMWASQVRAANADGTIVGHAVAGTVVTVRNPQTGFVRSVTAEADGSYRLPFLPVGDYVLQARFRKVSDGSFVSIRRDVRIHGAGREQGILLDLSR